MPKLKTFRVLMAETHAQYYEVRAQDEDQAFDRAIAYDEDKSWALGTWDEGVNDQSHAGTEEVDE
tara:strand:- start:213 stop:407 length:195 start_codon:yes stop_codon:yes gene_type:complete